MRFEILTIFPGFFAGIFEHGIVRRAQAEGLVEVCIHDLRGFTHDRHRTVDDRPFGGGEGMVLKPEPLAEALEALGVRSKREQVRGAGESSRDPTHAQSAHMHGAPVSVAGVERADANTTATATAGPTTPVAAATFAQDDSSIKSARDDSGKSTRVILLSAQGRPFTQRVARELAKLHRLVLICGRYEGVDERVNELYCDMELSIGDYVLSGGELAAAVVLDAVMRLVPGVLGNESSGEFESFGVADAEISSDQEGVPRSQHGAGGLLDYPHYTRPAEFGGLRAPEVLLNGDHLEIRRWRREQQLRKTLANRPDLLEGAELSAEDRRVLDGIRREEPGTRGRRS
jgi:tRNA (guanine37-N1)-methyltransferase